MELKKGNKYYLHGHGLAELQDTVSMTAAGQKTELLKFNILGANTKVMIPVNADLTNKVREPITAARAQELMESLNNLEKKSTSTNDNFWHIRLRSHEERMNSTNPEEVVNVIADLKALKVRQSLSFSETAVYQKALRLVQVELDHVLSQKVA